MVNKAELVSQKMLFKAKAQEDVSEYVIIIKDYDEDWLYSVLSTDEQKMAFWINLYNAFNLLFLNSRDFNLIDKNMRKQHFSERKISVAGTYLSLNDIEHGILRRSRMWWARGYVNKLFIPSFEKRFRLDKLHRNFHFGLYKGYIGCPSIHFYESFKIYSQLKSAAIAYLSKHVKIKVDTIILPYLFKEYIDDFRGKTGILSFLKKYQIINIEDSYKIDFHPEEWGENVTYSQLEKK